MRRPLVLLALLFGTGTAIGLQYPVATVSDWALLGGLASLWGLAVVLAMLRRGRLAQMLVLGLVCLLGVFSGRLPRGGTSLAALLPLAPDARVSATVSGVLSEVPEGDGASPLRMLLQVREVEVSGRRYEVQESVPVLVYGTYRWPPRQWEHWSFSGTLQYTPEAYRGEWLFVTGVRGSRRISPPSATLAVWSEQLRRAAAETLRVGMAERPDRYGVLHALLLGYRARLPPDVQQAFRRTGTMHVFAISGLHVGIICAVLVFAINLLRVPRTCRVLALAPVILLYAFMTGARASAVRAGIMAITYLAAPLFGRRSDSWSALVLAAMLIVAWRPDQLVDPGFIFSFTAVAGILAFVPLADRWLQHHLPLDPFREREKGAGVWAAVFLWVGRLVAVSVAAWVSTTPLSLYYFGRFAPVALFANLLVLPLAFLIVVTGCLALVAAATGGMALALVFNQANFAYVGLLTGGMGWLERLPWGYVENVQVGLPLVVLWYVVLVMVAVGLRRSAALGETDAGVFGVGV